MSQNEIRKAILRLEAEEESVARTTREAQGARIPAEDRGRVARQFLTADRTGVKSNVLAEAGSWADAVRNIPLIRQLLLFPTVVIDISPYKTEDALRDEFGVGLDDLLALADDGFVLFNIYEFDTQKRRGFEEYAASPGIERFLRHPNCRVNSIRRKHLLKALGFSASRIQEARQRGEEKFADALRALGTGERRSLLSNGGLQEAIEVAKSSYSYVELLGSDEPTVKQWIAGLPARVPASAAPMALKELIGLKTPLASSLVVAFGGIKAVGAEHLERMNHAWEAVGGFGGDRGPGPAAQTFDDSVHRNDKALAGLEELVRSASAGGALADHEVPVPRYLTPRQMETCRRVLREIASEKNATLQALDAARKLQNTDEGVFDCAATWLKVAAKHRRSQQRIIEVLQLAGGFSGGVLGLTVGALTGNPHVQTILTTLGSFLLARRGKAWAEWLHTRLLSREKTIILEYQDRLGDMVRSSRVPDGRR